MRTNSKAFMAEHFPELKHLPLRNSRMYEAKEKPGFLDDWWFRFDLSLAERNESIVLAGALDYSNTKFRILRVPSKFLLDNQDRIDIDSNGQVHLYIEFDSLKDIRNNANLSFGQFAIN